MGPVEHQGRPGALSLDPRYQTVAPDQCPSWDGTWLLNGCTGERRPARCKRNGCWYCLPRNGTRRSLALALAEPTLFITLTLVGDEWPTIRGRMKRWRYNLAARGHPLETAWMIEHFAKLDAHHAHIWAHGSRFVPFADVQASALREGMGEIAWIRPWATEGSKLGYGLKGISYGMKQADTESYLAINGGRLTHATRGFWRAGHGAAPIGVRAAEREAIARITPVCEIDRPHSCGWSREGVRT